jgi:hypothetical protein
MFPRFPWNILHRSKEFICFLYRFWVQYNYQHTQKRDFWSMGHIYSWEPDSGFCSQEKWSRKLYYRVSKSPPLLLTLNNLNSFHALALYFCKINFLKLADFIPRVLEEWAEWSVLLTQYSAGGKIETNEMDRACGTYGEGWRCAQGVGGEAWGKEAIGKTKT